MSSTAPDRLHRPFGRGGRPLGPAPTRAALRRRPGRRRVRGVAGGDARVLPGRNGSDSSSGFELHGALFFSTLSRMDLLFHQPLRDAEL